MSYTVTKAQEQKLLELPESGMGYQILRAIPERSNDPIRYIVFNAERVMELEKGRGEMKMLLKEDKASYGRKDRWGVRPDTIQPLSRAERSASTSDKGRFDHSKLGRTDPGSDSGASEKYPELPNKGEQFVRLSHFLDDKRVDFEKKCLSPGTYTTTRADYRTCIHYKDDPVDRYALPSDDPIEWAFYVEPYTIDPVQRGVVQHAFDHYGGGIEAYFANGTNEGTYLYRVPYGE